MEAEVEDEDEGEDDEEAGEEIGDFIDNEPSGAIDDADRMDERRHRDLDRRREMEEDIDATEMAAQLKKRYAKRRPVLGEGGGAVLPKRLLLPSVEDPKIFAVRCREGKEREAIYSIMKRIEERMGTKEELQIFSAFERAGTQSVMKGYIYVEAFKQPDVISGLDGIPSVFARSKAMMIDIKEMPDLLRVHKTPVLEAGTWVRLKRPAKYAGDLAEVRNVTENGLEARVRYIPRLDYGVRDEVISADGKRKRMPGAAGVRPPQRLFSEVEARRRNPKALQALTGLGFKNAWLYSGEEFINGFLEKDIKIQL